MQRAILSRQVANSLPVLEVKEYLITSTGACDEDEIIKFTGHNCRICTVFIIQWIAGYLYCCSSNERFVRCRPQAAYQTYLPLTVKHGDNADGGDDGGDDGGSYEAGALWLPYTISGDTVLPTYGTSVAVDGKGKEPGEDTGSPPGSGPQNR